jgi:hypothetical protein
VGRPIRISSSWRAGTTTVVVHECGLQVVLHPDRRRLRFRQAERGPPPVWTRIAEAAVLDRPKSFNRSGRPPIRPYGVDGGTHVCE